MPVTNFIKDKTKPTGLYSSCKDCYRLRVGSKKLEHKIIGYLDGFPITKGSSYPTIINIPDGYKRVHIYVMEKKLGHSIPKGFHVHHIDGDRMNWSEENLILIKRLEHYRLHAEERKSGKVYICSECGKQTYKCKSYEKYNNVAKRYRCAECWNGATKKRS